MDFYAGSIIGYRAWRVNPQTAGFDSPVIHCEWPDDKPMIGVCEPHPHRVRDKDCDLTHTMGPHNGCTCGLYAWHDFPTALENYAANSHSVIGAAVFWGKIAVHTKGFKAQYGRITAVVNQSQKTARRLGWLPCLEETIGRYSIPLLHQQDLEAYAETFGKPLGIDFDV